MTIPARFQALAQFYDPPNITEQELDAFIAQLPAPQAAQQLYEVFGTYVAAGHIIADIGCRDAKHTLQLIERFGVSAIGIDPLPSHVFAAATHPQFTIVQGVAEAIPISTNSVDAVWCRDVLPHITDIPAVFAECDRILRPGGIVCVYATVAGTQHPIPQHDYLTEHLFLAPDWHDATRLTNAAHAREWQLRAQHNVGSAWREAWEHDGTRTTSTQLLTLATLRRNAEQSIAQLGPAMYHSEYANALWGVFQMLGYIVPTIWVWQKPDR